jgi:hypothetical protein
MTHSRGPYQRDQPDQYTHKPGRRHHEHYPLTAAAGLGVGTVGGPTYPI